MDAIIRAHHHDYEFRVTFPLMYPDAPSVVRPLNMQTRLSPHQYGGADGPLCLQWGPDNWHSEITAAQMLESTHELLDLENPLGQDRPDVQMVAPSRHKLTAGQELRGQVARWYVSEELLSFLGQHSASMEGYFTFSFRDLGDSWGALVHEAAVTGGPMWKDPTIPIALPEAGISQRYPGAWIKTDLDRPAIEAAKSLGDLRRILNGQASPLLLANDGTSPVAGFGGTFSGVLVCDREGRPHLFVVLGSGTAVNCAPVWSETTPTQRAPASSVYLQNRKIAIVGLGAAGSKIAMTIARMGVSEMFLVDHDVLVPENLQRHAMDWQGVTQHKVDAVARAIGNISPRISVVVSRTHLAGQESNAAVNGVLARLAESDLLIDATANPKVFNLLAAVSRAATTPMIWFEIFGGGIGGLVARSRPGLDPSPQDMRAAYLHYCVENPAPAPLLAAVEYSYEDPSGDVLVASDSDVGIIAHHAARFVPDCFAPPDESVFPHSLYLVGMAKAWVFEAPFSTIPISTSWLPLSSTQDARAADINEDTFAFLTSLIAKAKQ